MRYCDKCRRTFYTTSENGRICPECNGRKYDTGEKMVLNEKKEFEINGKKVNYKPDTRQVLITTEDDNHTKNDGHITDRKTVVQDLLSLKKGAEYYKDAIKNIEYLKEQLEQTEKKKAQLPNIQTNNASYKQFKKHMDWYNKEQQLHKANSTIEMINKNLEQAEEHKKLWEEVFKECDYNVQDEDDKNN